jgi:hypothetical protein
VRAGLAPAIGAILLAVAAPAWAGPPYQTDDPEPTELGHWEFYNFVTVDGRSSDFDGEAGLDLNYGAAKGVQLTATLPLAFSHSPDSGWRGGSGDLELAGKYRFVNDDRTGWQAAIFPRAVTHDFSKWLSLGTELTWQSADTRDDHSSAGVDAGLIRKLGGPYSLLLAGGPSFSGGRTSYHAYTALGLNF